MNAEDAYTVWHRRRVLDNEFVFPSSLLSPNIVTVQRPWMAASCTSMAVGYAVYQASTLT